MDGSARWAEHRRPRDDAWEVVGEPRESGGRGFKDAGDGVASMFGPRGEVPELRTRLAAIARPDSSACRVNTAALSYFTRKSQIVIPLKREYYG